MYFFRIQRIYVISQCLPLKSNKLRRKYIFYYIEYE